MIFGIILAGGTGSRMKMGNFPKQFMEIGNRPIIIHSLETFLSCERLERIYLGIHPDWVEYTNELVEKYAPEEKERIIIVPGGNDRNSSLFNVIDDICMRFGEDKTHIIITHDAVRPFVTPGMIEDGIVYAEKYGACATVIPATDTVVVSYDGQKIDSMPARKYMYNEQTPQSFNMMKLKRLYESLTDEERSLLTDACGIFTYKGEYVHMAMGDATNIKITTASDLKIAEVFLEMENARRSMSDRKEYKADLQKMKCPKCCKEMEQGYFYAQRSLWSKNADKFTIIRGKDDIRLSASGSPAYRCENCRKIIVSMDY